MRLCVPTVQQIRSSDGNSLLTYEGYDQSPAQAGGGALYLLRVTRPDGPAEFRATVQSTTWLRAEEQARKDGLALATMRSSEIRKYQEKFAERHGKSHVVIIFQYSDEKKDGPARPIVEEEEYADIFCSLFLKLTALYRYNNSDYPECGEGFYPDIVEYAPRDGRRRVIKRVSALEGITD